MIWGYTDVRREDGDWRGDFVYILTFMMTKLFHFAKIQVYTRQENTVPQQQIGEGAGLHCPYKNINIPSFTFVKI